MSDTAITTGPNEPSLITRLAHRAAQFSTAASGIRARWLLFAVFIILTIARMPRVFFQGRLWAEEATVFYSHALITPWFSSLFFSYGGYLNFGADLPAVIASHLAPLDFAPRITLFFAFAAQICPALLLVTSRAPWLRSKSALAASLFLLVAAPAAEEVWLNSIHSQFFLALCTAFILAVEPESGRREIFRRILLFLAPLYGLGAIILLPLFALRAALDRSLPRLIQCLILAASSAFQLIFFFQTFPGRQTASIKLVLATIVAKNILQPLSGYSIAQPLIARLHAALTAGILPHSVILVLVLAVLLLLTLLYKAPKDAWWLALAGGSIALVSYHGALFASPDMIEPHAGNRYAFVPQVLLAWTLVVIAAQGFKTRAKIATGLVLWLCLVSAQTYCRQDQEFTNGPKWSLEMAKWHADPTYHPVAWPGGGWIVADTPKP
jgi:hypothetical protein